MARRVLDYTGADAVMIGRAAQGRPWIFREISHYLATGEHLEPPTWGELRRCLLDHLEDHYQFYGEYTGVRTARKHIGWYIVGMPGARHVRDRVNHVTSSAELDALLEEYRGYLLHTNDPTDADESNG